MTKYLFICLLIICYACGSDSKQNDIKINTPTKDTVVKTEEVWLAPDTSTIPNDAFGAAVRYGRKLVLNTAYYIGPEGIVSKNLGNKMNCTNCHLEAGTVPYGLNYLSTHARYPQYRAREDKILSAADRVNNCIERPHNGKALPLDGKEMTAIICYIKWLGQNVPTDGHVLGDHPMDLAYPDRAADPILGEKVFVKHCESCHGKNGEGKMLENNVTYQYPPLWGEKSYQPGSSMHRVAKAAKFIYCNMPHKLATYQKPVLTIEEAFDVAAFINDDRIHKRPKNNGTINYPDIKTKPLDYGTGPFIDSFPELQHKFGPYKPIIEWREARGLPTKF